MKINNIFLIVCFFCLSITISNAGLSSDILTLLTDNETRVAETFRNKTLEAFLKGSITQQDTKKIEQKIRNINIHAENRIKIAENELTTNLKQTVALQNELTELQQELGKTKGFNAQLEEQRVLKNALLTNKTAQIEKLTEDLNDTREFSKKQADAAIKIIEKKTGLEDIRKKLSENFGELEKELEKEKQENLKKLENQQAENKRNLEQQKREFKKRETEKTKLRNKIKKLKELHLLENMLLYAINSISKTGVYKKITIETITTKTLDNEGFIINLIRKLRHTEIPEDKIKTSISTIERRTDLTPLNELVNEMAKKRFLIYSQIPKGVRSLAGEGQFETWITYANTGIKVGSEAIFGYIEHSSSEAINYDFDLSGATFRKLILKGKSNTEKLTFNKKVILSGLKTKGIKFENVIFNAEDQINNEFNMNNANIQGTINIKNCNFKGKVSFKYIKTTDNINCKTLIFEKETSFDNATFRPGTFLSKTATFDNVTFTEKVNFDNVKFIELKRDGGKLTGYRVVNFTLKNVNFVSGYTKVGIQLPVKGKITVEDSTSRNVNIDRAAFKNPEPAN